MDQARSIAKQYSKYVSSGVIDMNSLKNKMEVIEDFMGTSIFVIDIKGSVSVVFHR